MKVVMVERIFTDFNCIDKYIPLLKEYFDMHTVPELINEKNIYCLFL